MSWNTPRHPVLMIIVVLAGIGAGTAAGVGAYTFIYAKGASYLHDDPNVCANCHIMRDHLDAYSKGGHHAVATCNDCHTLPGFIPKYASKALNGFNHSLAFTTGRFHYPLEIGAINRYVTEKACRKCHGPIVEMIDAHHKGDETLSCIRCHKSAGHLE